jgi:hypothetical protein
MAVDFPIYSAMYETPTSDKNLGLDMSTCEGDYDSSTESTRSQFELAAGGKPALGPVRGRSPARELADDYDDDEDHFSNDQAEMPSTREPSPEPMWSNRYDCQYVSRGDQVFLIPQEQLAQVRPPQMMPYPNTQYTNMPAARPRIGDMVLMPTPMPFPSAPQPVQASSAIESKAEPKTSSKKKEEVAQTKSGSKGKGQGPGSKKTNSKNRGEASAKGDALSNMSEENKRALANYIYDFMVQNSFTSPDGYLLVDVLAEVWKGMGDGSSGGRIAQHRFAELLRAAPEHFELFRKGIRVTNHCGWFARKGEKMVRLVPQTSA